MPIARGAHKAGLDLVSMSQTIRAQETISRKSVGFIFCLSPES